MIWWRPIPLILLGAILAVWHGPTEPHGTVLRLAADLLTTTGIVCVFVIVALRGTRGWITSRSNPSRKTRTQRPDTLGR